MEIFVKYIFITTANVNLKYCYCGDFLRFKTLDLIELSTFNGCYGCDNPIPAGFSCYQNHTTGKGLKQHMC